jgi:hypothetical protein
LAECGSLQCIDPTKCQKLSLNAQADTEAKVCKQQVDEPSCGAPHTFPCNQFITGWGTGNKQATCEKYSTTSPGHCDASSTCINSCAAIPSQTKVPHLSCASVGCVNPNSCTNATRSTAYTVAGDVCYTSARRGCEEGATCDSDGACVFVDDGKPCTLDVQCASNNCWRPLSQGTSGMGICCNQKCDNECQECSSNAGTCKARTGSVCSLNVPCSTVLKGFSTAAPNKCQRFKDNINVTAI